MSAPRRDWITLPRRTLLFFVAFLLAAFLTLPAVAEHIGPHRTTSAFVWERRACHYEAVYDPPGAGWYGCTLDLYGPPDSTCDSTSSVKSYFNSAACGWPAGFSCETLPCDISRSGGIESCSEGDEGCRAVEKTSSLPPATVSGSVSCGLPGSSGWCRGGAELSVSGSEPLTGYTILSLEGTLNGEPFACSGSACGVPLLDGGNSFTFWARSSYGDTSSMGSADGKLDSAAPSISGDLSGSSGDAGWFVSDVTGTASASDPAPGSGLASLEISVDGGGWGAYGGALVLSDGEHTVELRAADGAGNSAQESLVVRVDTQPPEIDLSTGTSFCPECGQSLDVELSVQDSGSGIVEWSLAAGGVLVVSGSGPASQTLDWDGSGLGGGSYTLTVEARDAAGNTIATSDSFDLIQPTPPPEPPTEDTSSGFTQQSTGAGAIATVSPGPTPTTAPHSTRTPLTVPFGALPAAPQQSSEQESLPSVPLGSSSEPSSTVSGSSSGPVFGAAALALIAAVSAFTLDQLRRRREEEAALRMEMERRNAAAQAREDAQRAALAASIAAAAAAATVSEALREEAESRSQLRREELLEMEQSLNPPAFAPQPTTALLPGYGEVAALQQTAEELRQTEAYRLWRGQEVGAGAAAATTIAPPLTGDNAQPGDISAAEAPWWKRALGWLQEGVERLVLHPPSFLSVSYDLRVPGTSLPSYALDEMITYQPLAQNALASIGVQQVSVRGDVSNRVTSNPTGRIDINFANGRITLHGDTREDGSQVNWFVQPGSLSFGSITSKPLRNFPEGGVWDTGSAVSVTTVDLDLGGPNWASFKVSQSQGSTFAATEATETGSIQISQTQLAQIEMSVHRYPRVAVAIGGALVIVEVGGALIALSPAVVPLLQQLRGVLVAP